MHTDLLARVEGEGCKGFAFFNFFLCEEEEEEEMRVEGAGFIGFVV
jgi:hypothetical protein